MKPHAARLLLAATGLMLGASVGASALAQTVTVRCTKPMTEAFLRDHPSPWDKFCADPASPSHCDDLERARREVQECRGSGQAHSHEKVLRITAARLTAGTRVQGEVHTQPCWKTRPRHLPTEVQVSATELSFKEGADSTVFVLDRRTLSGGYGKSRNWTCTVRAE